jgi:hypothetical protein
MKKYILTIITIIFFILPFQSYSQGAPPPPGQHGQSGNQAAGNAPIGSGLILLLGFGIAYGGKKVYNIKKKGLEN